MSKRYKAIPEEFEDKVVGFWELFSGSGRLSLTGPFDGVMASFAAPAKYPDEKRHEQ